MFICEFSTILKYYFFLCLGLNSGISQNLFHIAKIFPGSKFIFDLQVLIFNFYVNLYLKSFQFLRKLKL